MPEAVDLVVLGSGAAGLTAALTGVLSGLSVLVLEHEAFVGGTSARSSGTVWIPDNPTMRAAGIKDRVAAEQYLDALVGDRAKRDLRLALLDAGPAMLADLAERAGVAFRPYETAPDYRQDMPGAATGWRALEPLPFDGRVLGERFSDLAQPLPELMLFGGMMVTRGEATRLLDVSRPLAAARLGGALGLRFLADRTRWPRGTRLVLGNALVAQLLKACLERGIRVETTAETDRLSVVSKRVTGVERRDGRIAARRGVVLAGGGFPANPDWRGRELPRPVAQHTPASPGARGRTLELGLEAGATMGPAGMDNALWFPSSTMRRADGSTAVYPHIVLDRAKPGSFCVDATGRRFVNEAVSYHEFVRGMYRANGEGHSVPCWLVCGRAFIRRYGLGLIRPHTPSLARYVRNGYLTDGATLAELARKVGMPADALRDTAARMDRFAETGADEDFRRGETIYDRSNGDVRHGPNPCLGPIGTGPYYAVKLEPTPLGTSRGLATDRHARALDAQGAAIPGLWVAGNDMQSVFGGEYPGAGAQLGQAMTFGWIAARDAAGLAA